MPGLCSGDGSISVCRLGVCDSLGAEVLARSRLLPRTIRTFWRFFPQPLLFQDQDIHSVALNEINTSNSDSSVALIKHGCCLDGARPRHHSNGRRVLSSPKDEASKKTIQNKGKKVKDPLFFSFYFFAPDG